MKKISFLFLFFSFSMEVVSAQTKPELAPEFFDSFSYNLPAGFTIGDSVQLATEVQKIATKLDELQIEATTNYTISDPTSVYYFLNDYVSINTLLGRNSKAAENIYELRKIRPTPAYRLPAKLQILAWNRAMSVHKDDGSDAFKDALSK